MEINEKISFRRLTEEIPELKTIDPHLDELFFKKEGLTSKDIEKLFKDIIDGIRRNKNAFSDMNFYPSDQSTNCKNICISIATDKFGWKYNIDTCRTGFKGLIKELIQYWLKCGAVNQKTVIITLDWDDKDFDKDWKNIVDAYVSKGKVVKIYEVIESRGELLRRY